MPVQKSAKSPKSATGTAAQAASEATTTVKTAAKAPAKAAKSKAAAAPEATTKVKTVPTPKSSAELEKAADELLKKKPARAAKAAPAEDAQEAPKKKPGRKPKAADDEATAPKAAAKKAPAKRGRKPKGKEEGLEDDADLSDIEADLEREPEPEVSTTEAAPAEKVKPLRMKISKAKERALMKEFGLDETVLSEEDMAKRRSQLKKLITLGKTRGYLTWWKSPTTCLTSWWTPRPWRS